MALTQDIGLLHLIAGKEIGATIQRGFTTLRDVGGPGFGLQITVDRRAAHLPGGCDHQSDLGAWRFPPSEQPANNTDYAMKTGMSALAHGVPKVLRHTREQLMAEARSRSPQAAHRNMIRRDRCNCRQQWIQPAIGVPESL